MRRSQFLIALLATSFFISSVQASGTLDKIKKSGTIQLGVRDTSVPFSYLDDKQKYIGYSVDLCMKIVESVQKKLGLSSLNVKTVPVTVATRIPLLVNGTIDISCDTANSNFERAKRVAFSAPIFFVNNGFLAKKSSNIKKITDLKAKPVVVIAGAANLSIFTALNKEHQLGMRIVTAKDNAEAFLMIETGRAAALTLDDVLLAFLVANSKTPQDYIIFENSVPLDPYGLPFRQNDPEFKKVVDSTIADVFKSGEIRRIYSKWFESPIPPKGINLNWPMNERLKKAYN